MENKKRWYSIELSVKDGKNLSYFLKNNKIKYESSGMDGYWCRIEIYANEIEVSDINDFIDSMTGDMYRS